MKQTKHTIIYIGILTIFLFHLPNLAQAKAPTASIRVSPVILTIPLSPDKTYTQEITVENLTTKPMPLKATLNDFASTGEEGGYIFEDTKTSPLLTWTKLNETDFILTPKEKKKIALTIKTPQTIPLGGYYGMLFLQPILKNDPTTTQVQSKVGILLLANIGVPNPKAKKAEVTTFSTDMFPASNTLPVLLRVKNISLHFFTAKPILTISPVINLSQKEEPPIYLEEKIIFQQKIRRWQKEIPLPKLQPNIYKAHMRVSTGNGQSVTTENYFIIFPFAKAGIAVLLTLIVLFFIIKRNRLKKTLQAFLSSQK